MSDTTQQPVGTVTLDECARVLRALLNATGAAHVYTGASGAEHDEELPRDKIDAQIARLVTHVEGAIVTHGLYCCDMNSDEYVDGLTMQDALAVVMREAQGD